MNMIKTCVLAGFLAVIGMVFAQNVAAQPFNENIIVDYVIDRYDRYCSNDTTLTFRAITTNTTDTYDFRYNITCPYGCEDGLDKYGADCVEPPYFITFQVIIGLVLLFILIVWIGRRR